MKKIVDYLLHGKEKGKLWLAVVSMFVFGAVTCNVGWVWYSNAKDARTELRIEKIERSHNYQMGQQRIKIENKIDEVLYKLDKQPASQIVIDAKSALMELKE